MEYNVTALNEEITKIEQAKSNISNILYEKGRPVTNNSALSDIVSNILPLSNIRRYNTNVEKNLDKTVENGTVSMVYGPYINSDSTTIFTTNIYLPKQLSVTANDVRTLGSGTILAKLVYQSSGNDFAQIIINTVDNKYIVKLEILDYTLNIDDIIWELNTDNVYTRNDAITGYRILNTESAVIYSTNVTTRNLAYEILQISSTYKFNGLYLYNVTNWEPLPLGVTANISTIFTGKTALTDNGIVTGIGTSDATAISGDIWKNTAYVNGEKVTGTLQVTQNVTREELDSKIDMWNTFTNFSTTSNDLSYLYSNMTQKLLPTITANSVENVVGMYNNCRNLIEVNLSKLNSNTMVSTKEMFMNCHNLSYVDVTNWNVVNLKDTTSMFENCKNLTNLNVSKWNTYNVGTMPKMFKNCQKMENISFTNWNTSNVSNMEAIFESCDRFTNASLQNVVNMLPDATQLTNTNAFNLGIDMDRYTSEQLFQLSQKNYTGAPLPYNMYYNIVNLDDGTYYLLNKGDDLDKGASKLYTYINMEYNNGMYNVMIEDNRLKDGTITSFPWRTFENKSNYITLDLSGLNVCNLTNVSSLFYGMRNLHSLNIYNWDIGKVSYISQMFMGCNNLRELNISKLNVSNKVYSIYSVFENCSNLLEVDVSNWDTSNVVWISNIFYNCRCLTNIDVSNWNVSKISNFAGMFTECANIKELNLSKWNTNSLNTVVFNRWSGYGYIDRGMFAGCSNLTDLNCVNFNLSKVWNLNNMFSGCVSLINLDISNWDVSNISTMIGLFLGCRNLTNIDVSNWDISKVTTIRSIFSQCNKLITIDVSNWNTSNVTDMSGMFYECSSLTNIDVSNWDISKVTDISNMFNNCPNIHSLNLNHFNMKNVKSLSSTFANCISLTNLSINNWQIDGLVSMTEVFRNCRLIDNLNLCGWDVSNVTSVNGGYSIENSVFFNCRSLQNIDVSAWNFVSLTNSAYMFHNCVTLHTINVNNWNMSNLNCSNGMFKNCLNLKNIDVSNWNSQNITNMWSMFSKCNNLSDASVDSIINMVLNAVNYPFKSLRTGNQASPFYETNISSTRYQNRLAELDAAGWIY